MNIERNSFGVVRLASGLCYRVKKLKDIQSADWRGYPGQIENRHTFRVWGVVGVSKTARFESR